MSPPTQKTSPSTAPPQSAAQQAQEELLAFQEWLEGGHEAEEREEESRWFPDLGGYMGANEPINVKTQGCHECRALRED
jgi:hypothetical protein